MDDDMSTLGSKWRKWDLHVHTPASYGGEYSDFISAASKAEADVIGINDYFSVSGYKNIIELGGIPEKVLFPVVEFRMNNILETKSKGNVRLNFHLIFNNDPTRFQAIENWLNSLNCMVANGQTMQLGTISPTELQEKVQVDFFKVVGSLTENSTLRREALVWVPYDEHGGIDEINPDSDSYFKSGVIIRADILGSSNVRQRDFFLWNSQRHTPEQIRDWLVNRRIACIKGSDAHSVTYPIGRLQNENSEPIEKFCWIKGDPTFEGLRQVTFEPEHRIHLGTEAPQHPLRWIRRVEFDFPQDTTINDDAFCFSGKSRISFSPNLTCLIGGRGTGKSTALSLMYEKLNPRAGQFEVLEQIDLPDGRAISDCIHVEGGDRIDYVEYLAQNEIEEFAKDHKKFTDAIYARISRLDQERKLLVLQNEVERQAEETQSQIEREIKVSRLSAQIVDKKKELEANKTIITSIESTEYKQLSSVLSELGKKESRITRGKAKYHEIRQELTDLLGRYPKHAGEDLNAYEQASNALLDNLITLLAEEPDFGEIANEEAQIQTSSQSAKESLLEFLRKRDLSQEDMNDISGATERIEELGGEIKALETELTSLNEELAAFDSDALRVASEAYAQEIGSQLLPVSNELGNLRGEVKPIHLNYEFDTEQANSAFLEEFQAAFGRQRIDYLSDYVFRMRPLDASDKEVYLKAILGEAKNPNKTQSAIVEILNDDTNFRVFQLLANKTYLETNKFKLIRVTYDSKPLENCSFGQRCTATLVILLLLGNTPIIIDEPEAHLDSSLIANYLVDTIKRKKQGRQIIFATHNANFVINGDAELINILEVSDDGISTVKATTIEDMEHRSNLLALEGGEEAFERRGDKYNISHRLRS